MVVEGNAARFTAAPIPVRPSAVTFSNSSASSFACDSHHAASSALFAKVIFFNSSNIATPLLRLEVSPESFLCRPSRNYTDLRASHRRNHDQNSAGVGLADLSDSLLAITELYSKVNEPVEDFLLWLGR